MIDKKDKQLTIRLKANDLLSLQEIADKKGISVAKLVRRQLKVLIEQKPTKGGDTLVWKM